MPSRALSRLLLSGLTLASAGGCAPARPAAAVEHGTPGAPGQGGPSPAPRAAQVSGGVTSVSPDASAPCARPPRRDGEAVLAFGGDVIAHEALRDIARGSSPSEEGALPGYRAMLAGARAAFRGADLAFVNLESPVTSRSARRGDLIFHADEPMLAALAETGVRVVSVANNHAYDQGPRGLADTLEATSRLRVERVGAATTLRDACAPVFVTVRGIKIAFLARTLYMNFKDDGPPHVCMLARGPLERAARAARASGAELVIASLHWGDEYRTEPDPGAVAFARHVVGAGVDVVVGHHPHVLQRVERVSGGGREALIAYSLGNLLSNQGHDYDPGSKPERAGDTRDVAVLRVAVGRAGDGSVRVRDVSAVPLWTERSAGAITLVPATTRRARVAARLGVPLVDAPDDACAHAAGLGEPAAGE